jgi:lipoteichoic acid synthase
MADQPILVRYYCPKAHSVVWHWGVNDWQALQPLPPGTQLEWGLMATPLKKNGDFFEAKILLPSGSYVDHGFSFYSQQGRTPWQNSLRWYDINNKPGTRNDRFLSDTATSITVYPQPYLLRPETSPGILRFGLFWCVLTLLLVALLVAKRKWMDKKNPEISSAQLDFAAASPSLWSCLLSPILAAAWILLGWRCFATGLFYPLLVFPRAAWGSYGAALQEDFLALAIFLGGVTVLYFIHSVVDKFVNPQQQTVKKKWFLFFYQLLLALFLVLTVLGHFFLDTVGKPFNFAWLYYGDFLQSTDAKQALWENLRPAQILAPLMVVVLFWWLTNRFKKVSLSPKAKTVGAVMLVVVFLFVGYSSWQEKKILAGADGYPATKHASWVRPYSDQNPLVYFLRSLQSVQSLKVLPALDLQPKQLQALAGQGPFPDKSLKPLSSLLPLPPSALTTPAIEHVVVFVLESTPAHLLSLYNPKIQAIPFLQSLRHQGLWFENIYAQVPATNKSLVSLLCANQPWLSYQSITKEKPQIAFPALPQILKNQGMATAFFNGGDLRFQNGDQFLKGRGFDTLVDQRNNPFATNAFNDPRYAAEHLGGISDGDLVKAYLHWMDQHPAQKPSFSLLWTFQTHYPYYTNGPGPVHLEKGATKLTTSNPSLNKYLTALSESDAALQNLVAGLKAKGKWEKTLLVVVGDHGEAFGEHNQTTHANGIYEENIHVPLGFIWGGYASQKNGTGKSLNHFSGTVSAGSATSPRSVDTKMDPTLGSLADLAPTILSLIGLPAPAHWQGQSLFQKDRPQQVYFFSPFSEQLYGIRTQTHKLILNTSTGEMEYYDLTKDPKEEHNSWDPKNREAQKTLHSLQAWMLYQQQWMKGYLK